MTTTEHRVALVTGATRGIGRRIAASLAAEGWDLVLAARDAQALTQLAEELRDGHGISATAQACDLSDEGALLRLAEVTAGPGRLDALVLNAGMGSIGPFADFPARRLDRLFVVNTRSAFVLIQALLPVLRHTAASGPLGAKVVALASTTGLVGEPLNAAYGASKAALISLCETLNTEESTGGISATAVCPGYVATDMTEGLHDSVPPDEMLDAADVAEVVLSLLRLSKRCVIPQIALTRPGAHVWRA